MTLQVLGFAGCMRAKPYNRVAPRALADLAPVGTIEILDSAGFPLYNNNVREQGYPPPMQTSCAAITQVRARLIATPEYNCSLPGALKNVVDWALQLLDPPLNGKPAAIMSAFSGPHAGSISPVPSVYTPICSRSTSLNACSRRYLRGSINSAGSPMIKLRADRRALLERWPSESGPGSS